MHDEISVPRQRRELARRNRRLSQHHRAQGRRDRSSRRTPTASRSSLEATSGGFWDWNIQTGDTVSAPATRPCWAMPRKNLPEITTPGKTWSIPDDVERVKQHHADHFAGLTDYSIEFRMKEKSGNWHWVHSRGLLIERDPEGKPLRMVGTHSDIQARKRAEEERERPSSIGACPEDGVLSAGSPAASLTISAT